jgi:hypothetical protein
MIFNLLPNFRKFVQMTHPCCLLNKTSMKPEYFICILLGVGWLVIVKSFSLVNQPDKGAYGIVRDSGGALNEVTMAPVKPGTNTKVGGRPTTPAYLLDRIQAGTNITCGDYTVRVDKRFGNFVGGVLIVSRYGLDTVTAEKGTLSQGIDPFIIMLDLQNVTLQHGTNTFQLQQLSIPLSSP